MIKKVENNNSCWNLSSVWYLDWLEFLGIWAEDRSMTLHFTWKLLPSASKLGIWNCGCLLNRIMKIIILYLFCNNFEFIYRDNFWINSKSYQRKFTLSTATVKCQCKFSLNIESYNRIALLAGDIYRTISQNLSQTHCTPDNVGTDHKTPCQAVFTTFNLQS